MKRFIAIADRAASLSLRLIVAINVLFLLSFLLSFLLMVALATSQARAEVACTGENLLATLKTDDPALLQKIDADAARTPNGKGLLWKLEKDGRAPSFLFGTMHMTDPRVTELPAAARSAFDASATVVIETTEILDQAKMMAAILQKPELMMFTDDTTLMSLFSKEDAEAVAKALEARGIPPSSVAKMKPWMLSAMVALPACELARKSAGAVVLDAKLAHDAQAAGKGLEGLESVVDQLSAMASLPMEFHVKGLVETLKLGDRIDDVMETMIVLYEAEETGMFWPLFRATLPSGEGEDSGYAAFEETMITARNKTMAERAEPILAKGNAFIAVGALHLPGSEGLIEIFRKAGYTVTAAGGA